jgi:hypothetical protein
MYIRPLGNHYMMYLIKKLRWNYIPFPINRVNIMVYQNHRLEMLIQWKRWMTTKIYLDQ